MQIPQRKNMHWLKTETQEDVNRLYAMYEKANKCMVPMHEVHHGKVLYLLTYITDTGVNEFMRGILEDAAGREIKRTGDLVRILVEEVGRDIMYCSLTLDGGHYLKCCWGNYGRSWRLSRVT